MRVGVGLIMAIARTTAELNRWSDLAIIRRAIAARMPEQGGRAGLSDVAEVCRRHALAHPERHWNDVRDDMLMICCEWDWRTMPSMPNRMHVWTAWLDS